MKYNKVYAWNGGNSRPETQSYANLYLADCLDVAERLLKTYRNVVVVRADGKEVIKVIRPDDTQVFERR